MTPTTCRTVFHGDNLKFLQALDTNSVDLIVTDPPYNKSRDFVAVSSNGTSTKFQDRWNWADDINEKYLETLRSPKRLHLLTIIESACRSYGDDMGAFLCFMAVRLVEMERVLKPTGSIYLQCDDFTSHWMRVLMEGIFGHTRFKSAITWKRSTGHGNSKGYGRVTDTILFFSGSDKIQSDAILTNRDPNYVGTAFKNCDRFGHYRTRSPYLPLTAKSQTTEATQPWRGINPTSIGPGKQWRVWSGNSKQGRFIESVLPGYADEPSILARLEMLYQAGMIYFAQSSGLPVMKQYAEANAGGNTPSNLWTDIPTAQGNESVDYPTQKPLALMERMIKASSKPGDVVLDPFAGSGTTLVAAERLGRQWIGMDLNDVSSLVEKRLLTQAGVDPEVLDLVEATDESPIRSDYVAHPLTEPKPVLMTEYESKQKLKTDHVAKLRQRFDGDLRCEGCYRELPEQLLEVDHNFPESLGGQLTANNINLLCSHCNRIKSNKLTMHGLHRKQLEARYMDLAGYNKYHDPS